MPICLSRLSNSENKKKGIRIGERGTGNSERRREVEHGNSEQGTESREQGTENREQGAGNKERGTGNIAKPKGKGQREQGTVYR